MASTHDEKSAFHPITEQVEPHDEHLSASANVFDTPKTSLSRSTTRDASTSPSPSPGPTRPCPAARAATNKHLKPGLLRLDTTSTAPDLEKGFLSAPASANTRDGGAAPSPLYSPCREYSVNGNVKECSMWPSRQTLKSKARQEKMTRRRRACHGCVTTRWGLLSKRQKLAAKILLALVVICFAVGVAVGISRAVGGGVYAGQNSSQTIPGSPH